MFDYLTKLSVESDVDDRKIKRKARSKAWGLGHSMSRFYDGTSRCKTCERTMDVKDGQVHGPAVTEKCTQQMFFEVGHDRNRSRGAF